MATRHVVDISKSGTGAFETASGSTAPAHGHAAAFESGHRNLVPDPFGQSVVVDERMWDGIHPAIAERAGSSHV